MRLPTESKLKSVVRILLTLHCSRQAMCVGSHNHIASQKSVERPSQAKKLAHSHTAVAAAGGQVSFPEGDGGGCDFLSGSLWKSVGPDVCLAMTVAFNLCKKNYLLIRMVQFGWLSLCLCFSVCVRVCLCVTLSLSQPPDKHTYRVSADLPMGRSTYVGTLENSYVAHYISRDSGSQYKEDSQPWPGSEMRAYSQASNSWA